MSEKFKKSVQFFRWSALTATSGCGFLALPAGLGRGIETRETS